MERTGILSENVRKIEKEMHPSEPGSVLGTTRNREVQTGFETKNWDFTASRSDRGTWTGRSVTERVVLDNRIRTKNRTGLKIDQMAHFLFFCTQIVGGGLFGIDL